MLWTIITVVARYINPHITANSKDRGAIAIRNVATESCSALTAGEISLNIGKARLHGRGITMLVRIMRTGG